MRAKLLPIKRNTRISELMPQNWQGQDIRQLACYFYSKYLHFFV